MLETEAAGTEGTVRVYEVKVKYGAISEKDKTEAR